MAMAAARVVGVLLLVARAVAGDGQGACVAREDLMHTQLLRRGLLCSYDPAAGPTLDPSKQARVQVTLLRSRMDVDETTNSLTLFGYLVLSWKDERLVWDRGAHHNVTRIYVDSEEIWTPSIALVENPTSVLKSSQALVVNGTVVYNLLVPLRSPCLNDASRWPYDRVVCNMSIANLSPGTAKLNNSAIHIGLVRWRSRGWIIAGVSMKAFRSTAFQDGLLVRVEARRSVDVHEATAVLPTALLAALTLASLWLPAHSPQRPLLLCSVILLQVLMSEWLALRIPVVGAVPPNVLLLLRDTLLVSGAALLQWLLARWLLLRPRGPWTWPLGVLADLAPGSHLAAAVLCLPPDQDGQREDVPDYKAVRVSVITDRATFVLLAVLCGALSARLLP